jgi:hypothetical protein
MWELLSVMTKKKSTRASKSKEQQFLDEKMDDEQHSTDEKSPDKKRHRPASQRSSESDDSEEGEYETSSDLDEDEQKIAKFITEKVTADINKNLTEQIPKAVADSVKTGFTELFSKLAEVMQTANSAKATADEALEVAKGAKAEADRAVQKATDGEQKMDQVEKTAASAQKTADEALSLVLDLGKKFSELSTQNRAGQPSTSALESVLGGAEGPLLFEDAIQQCSTPADRLKKLFVSYKNTIHEAKSTRTFILGRKKGETDATLAAAKIVMDCFFPDVGCVVTKTDKAKAAKVYVPNPDQAQQLRAALKSSWQALGSQGWWLKEEQPQQLSNLEARARAFVAEAKKSDPALDKIIGFVTIEYGMALKDGKEILPLFLVPPQTSPTWKPLFRLFASRIEDLASNDMLGDYADDGDFYLKWIDTAGLSKLGDDVRALRASHAAT